MPVHCNGLLCTTYTHIHVHAVIGFVYTPRLIYACLHGHLMASHERDQLTHGPTRDTGYITKLFQERGSVHLLLTQREVI